MHKTIIARTAAVLTALCLAAALLPELTLTARADSPQELTVTFDDNRTGGTSSTDNEMKTAVEAALSVSGAPSQGNVATLKLVGTATEITGYNAGYLNFLPSESGWTALTKVDLSGMSSLVDLKHDTWQLYSNKKIEEVVLPNSLKTLAGAFAYWKALEKVNLPDGLESVGDQAFYECTSLKQIPLPASLRSIGRRVFAGCTGLEQISLPASLKSIGGDAFLNCKNLKQIFLPAALESVGESAFAYWASLTSVTCLGADAPTLGANVFYYTNNSFKIYVPADGSGYRGAAAEPEWQALSEKLVPYAPASGYVTGIENGGSYPSNSALTFTFHPGEKDIPGVDYQHDSLLLTTPKSWKIGPNADTATKEDTFDLGKPYTATIPAGSLPVGGYVLTLEFDSWEEYTETGWEKKTDSFNRAFAEFVITAVPSPSPSYSSSSGPSDYTVTATAGPGGTISPLGETVVPYGENLTLTVTAEQGYEVDKVVVDGEKEVELTNGSYTFREVREPYTIHATFRAAPVLPGEITVSPQTGACEPLAALPIGLALTAAALLLIRRRRSR